MGDVVATNVVDVVCSVPDVHVLEECSEDATSVVDLAISPQADVNVVVSSESRDSDFDDAFREFRVDPVDVSEFTDLIGLVCEDDMVIVNSGDELQVDMEVRNKLFQKVELVDKEMAFARLAVVQNGGVVIYVRAEEDSFWESLPQYVSIDDSISTCEMYACMYDVEVPLAVVEIGPGCVAPVFSRCVMGVCDCKYYLAGTVCQLKPCRFASAILGFGVDVTTQDAYVVTSVYGHQDCGSWLQV